jgi:hypothetical protein
LDLERSVEKLDHFGQGRGAEAEGALDDAGLPENIADDVEGRCLCLAERAHHLEAFDRRVGRLERFEASDRLDQLLELAMIGLDNVVEVFDLPVLRIGRTPTLPSLAPPGQRRGAAPCRS